MSGYKSSWTGTLQNSDILSYLQKQSIMTFASTSARDTALSGQLRDGLWAYTTDTPKRLWLYNGSSWVCMWSTWVAVTPTWSSGITAGDGTFTAAYRYVGGDVRFRGQFALGSTSAVTGVPNLNLPLSISTGTYPQAGSAWIRDDNTEAVYGLACYSGIGFTTLNFRLGDGNAISASNPITWAAGDLISWDITLTDD